MMYRCSSSNVASERLKPLSKIQRGVLTYKTQIKDERKRQQHWRNPMDNIPGNNSVCITNGNVRMKRINIDNIMWAIFWICSLTLLTLMII